MNIQNCVHSLKNYEHWKYKVFDILEKFEYKYTNLTLSTICEEKCSYIKKLHALNIRNCVHSLKKKLYKYFEFRKLCILLEKLFTFFWMLKYWMYRPYTLVIKIFHISKNCVHYTKNCVHYTCKIMYIIWKFVCFS